MKKLTINPAYTKTYKTVANLDKALERLNIALDGLRYLECWTEDGRVTAVFVNATEYQNGVYLSFLASKGFKCVS